MKDNVFIVARERGKIVARRQGHNVFTESGRTYLASLISFVSFSPDTPEVFDRIKSLGFGIGGMLQNNSAVADAAPVSTAYPAGSDPNATAGNEYNDAFPDLPLISTLERPVRFSGTSDPYDTAPGTDVWRKDFKSCAHPSGSVGETIFRFFIGPASSTGELIYAPFTVMPLSELGLFHAGPGVLGAPFSTLVAYKTFDTINVTEDIELDIAWIIQF